MPPMTARRAFLFAALAAFGLGAGPAAAHPHIFAEARLDVVVAPDATVTSMRNLWRFDDLFSSTVLVEFDKNKDLKLDDSELLEVANTIYQSLAEFDYFQLVTHDGKDVAVKPPERLIASFEANQLVVLFETTTKEPMKLAGKVPVYYITGNDEALRRYSPASLGGLHLLDKLVLTIDGERYWFFHGDIFDMSTTHARWLARLGGVGYDLLIRINTVVNWCLERMGRPRMSFSKRIKQRVKRAVSYISDFEETAASIAVHEGHDHVVCGHIHQPQMRRITTPKGSVGYMNSGDWIEHLSALEYSGGKWRLYMHGEDTGLTERAARAGAEQLLPA